MGVQQLPKRIPSARMTYRTLLASLAYTPRLVVCSGWWSNRWPHP